MSSNCNFDSLKNQTCSTDTSSVSNCSHGATSVPETSLSVSAKETLQTIRTTLGNLYREFKQLEQMVNLETYTLYDESDMESIDDDPKIVMSVTDPEIIYNYLTEYASPYLHRVVDSRNLYGFTSLGAEEWLQAHKEYTKPSPTQLTVETLSSIEIRLTFDDFDAIFGKLSGHIWGSFAKHKFSLLKLYRTLGDANRSKLIGWLNEQITPSPTKTDPTPAGCCDICGSDEECAIYLDEDGSESLQCQDCFMDSMDDEGAETPPQVIEEQPNTTCNYCGQPMINQCTRCTLILALISHKSRRYKEIQGYTLDDYIRTTENELKYLGLYEPAIGYDHWSGLENEIDNTTKKINSIIKANQPHHVETALRENYLYGYAMRYDLWSEQVQEEHRQPTNVHP